MSDALAWQILCGAQFVVLLYVIDYYMEKTSELTAKLMSRNFHDYQEALRGPAKKEHTTLYEENDVNLNEQIHPF